MYVAVGQFAVTANWQKNAETCVSLMAQAAAQGASLLVLPEALLARDDNDPDLSVKSAQPLDGGFLTMLLAESARNELTTVLTVHVPSTAAGSLSSMPSCIFTMRSIFRNPGWWMRERECRR